MKTLTLAACTLVGLFSLTAPDAGYAQSTDVVRLVSSSGGNSTVRGTVLRMNKRNVTIESGGSEQRIEVNDIRFITFSSEPRDLREARTDLLEGRDNRAYEKLSAINMDEVTTDFARYEVRYMLVSTGVAMALRGEDVTLPEARQSLDDLLADAGFGDNYHYYEAVKLRADMSFATGDYESAEERYAELAGLPWPRVSLDASRWVAESQLGLDKYEQALENFQAVAASELNDVEAQQTKMFSQIGEATALAGLNRANEGIAILETLIKQESSENKPLFAKLYNSLGRCYLKAGNPKYAKHQFLHVVLIFYQDPDSHAEALYQLVDLWAQENNVRNSNDCRDTLRNRYPNSVWTNRL